MTDYEQNLPNEQETAQQEYAAPGETAPNASAVTRRNRKKQENRPVRRVGTVTMGIVLILGGCVALAAMFVPNLNWVFLLKFSPLLLVLLGLEVLWFGAHQGNVRIKYDFVSMIVCLFMLAGSVGLSLAAPVFNYYVNSQKVGDRLAWELQESTSQVLRPLGVTNAEFSFDFGLESIDPDMTPQDLKPGQLSHVTIQIGGEFKDKAEFAQTAADVLHALDAQGLKPSAVQMFGKGTAQYSRYTLWMGGRYALAALPQDLEDEISYDAPDEEQTQIQEEMPEDGESAESAESVVEEENTL